MVKTGVAGVAGRMGQALVRAVASHPQLTLAAAWDVKGNPAVGQDAGTVSGQATLGVQIREAGQADLKACQVVIDFTTPEATAALAAQAAEAGCALVIGTTGLSEQQLAGLRQAAERIGVVYATNYSTGINLLWALARQAATVLGEAYDAEIIESHHNQKKDAPSGTALTLLEAICQGKGLNDKTSAKHGRQGMIGARPAEEVGVHAIRAGDITGDHLVLFAGEGERLELRHQAHTRDTFARGAARAVAWVQARPAGFYHMADVLGLNDLGRKS